MLVTPAGMTCLPISTSIGLGPCNNVISLTATGGDNYHHHDTFCRGEKISLGMVEEGEGNLCGREDTKGFLVWRERTSSSWLPWWIPSWCSNCSIAEG